MLRLSAFILSALVSVACSKNAVPSLQSLGGNLTQLKTTGLDPFLQSYSANKYVTFQGSCLSVVKSFQIAFDGGTWLDIPVAAPAAVSGVYNIGPFTPSYTEGTVSGTPYDLDCADGTFSFYIYSHQIDEWAFAMSGTSPGNLQVSQIALRGVAGGFTTEPVIYYNSNGNLNGPPTKMTLTKWGSNVGADVNSCVELTVTLRSATALPTQYGTPLRFSLAHSLNSVADAPSAFPTVADCVTNNNAALFPLNSVLLPANTSQFRMYYKVGAQGENHSFTLGYAGPIPVLDVAGAVVNFDVKSSSQRWIDLTTPYKVLTSLCYPFQINLRSYGGANYVEPSALSFTISKPADMNLFSDASCTNSVGSPLSMTGLSQKTIYFTINPSTTSDTGTFGVFASGYDLGLGEVFYDRSGNTSVNYIRINGPLQVSLAQPDNPFSVSRYNKYGSGLPIAAALTVSISSSTGAFCDFAGCSTHITSVTIPSGSSGVTVYYEPGSLGADTMSASAASVSNFSQSILVSP